MSPLILPLTTERNGVGGTPKRKHHFSVFDAGLGVNLGRTLEVRHVGCVTTILTHYEALIMESLDADGAPGYT